MRGWRRVAALGWRERGWLALATVALPLLRRRLAREGFNATLASLERRWPVAAEPCEPDAEALGRAHALASVAMMAGRRGPIAATCLPQALFVYAVLRHRGFDPSLRIGVRQDGSGFGAHAWVELAGEALAHPSLDYAPLAGGGLHAHAGTASALSGPPRRDRA